MYAPTKLVEEVAGVAEASIVASLSVRLLGRTQPWTRDGTVGVMCHIVAYQRAGICGTVIADRDSVVGANHTDIEIDHAIAGGVGGSRSDAVGVVADGGGNAVGVHVVLVAVP